MSSEVLLVERVQEFRVWTLHRPDKLNALNSELLSALDVEGQRLETELLQNPLACRALILKGAGTKAFVAGADIAEMKNFRRAEAERFSLLGQRAFTRLEQLPVPTIASIQGFALGGGLELAMCCDVLIGEPGTSVGQPEAHLGLIPGFGGTVRFPERLGTGKALQLLFSGQRLNATEALSYGLLQEIAPSKEELFSFTLKVAEDLTKKSGPRALKAIKTLVHENSKRQGALLAEAKAFGEIFESDDKEEGVRAFLEKRPAQFTGQ